MNWERPEAVMRIRIQGLIPTCWNCKHGVGKPPVGHWCHKRIVDPAPHIPAGEAENNPAQVCGAWDERT